MNTISKVYTPLILTIQSILGQLSAGGPALLIFWAGRGGGKTSFLRFLRETYINAHDTTLLGPWDFSSSLPEALGPEILTAVKEAPASNRKLVLLDNLDELLRINNSEPFSTFEHRVLQELIGRGDTLIIATSRTPLFQWRDYGVRETARSLHIPPISQADVAEWAKAQGLDPERAFALSLGHPHVLKWLEERPDLPLEEIDRRVAILFLDGLSEKTRQMAEVASLFPAFDLAVLRPPLVSEEDAESFYGEYIERLEELMQAGLVAWGGEVGAYRFR
ncbi:MAG: hypothetical protein ACPLYD_15405, partial [Anaerolineae bacterium]